jgi:hypothetical protein
MSSGNSLAKKEDSNNANNASPGMLPGLFMFDWERSKRKHKHKKHHPRGIPEIDQGGEYYIYARNEPSDISDITERSSS